MKSRTDILSPRFVFFLLLPVCFSVYLFACSKSPAEHELVTPSDGKIILPVALFSDGKVHFFTYKRSGKLVNFFVRTDGKGNLSTYFDACYTCYKKKKGYREEGDEIICNECDLKFRLADEIWENKDCSPIMFRSQIENNRLIIETATLEKGVRLF